MNRFDAVIIGAGMVGCSIARGLAGAGLQVAVMERGTPGREASWAAAGMLSPSAEAVPGSPLFDACRASLGMYRSFAADLESETGIDPRYRTDGTLLIYEDEAERENMLSSVTWQRSLGVPIEELSGDELRKREPSLAAFPGGFFLAEDHQIDNRLLMEALVESCARRSVQFVLGSAVREVECNGREAAGVLLGDRSIAAGCVVNTAGAWAGSIRIAELPPAPIRPVKGHVVLLESGQPILHHVIRSHRVYLVPRQDGRVIVGSTMEEAGFDKAPRAGPIANLLRAAQTMCPRLEQYTIKDFWAGLRPAAPDGLPILGPTRIENYWTALGHFRNGILLTPWTAQVLTSWLTAGKSLFPVDSFIWERFEK